MNISQVKYGALGRQKVEHAIGDTMMSGQWKILCWVGVAVFVCACGKKEPPPPNVHVEPVGVRECDDYLRRLQGCIGRAAAVDRPLLEKRLAEQNKSFQDATATPEAKVGLPNLCKKHLSDLVLNPVCR